MMKKRVLLFLLVFVMLFVLGLVLKSFISASIFDTWAAYSATSPNITIDAFPPDIIVDSPTSTDYSTTNLIDINYSVSDSASGVDTVWYNLDGGANTTLTGNATVRLPHNNYVLYMYANDTAGLLNGSESVSFSISSESFKHVNFSRFDVPTTTNFSALNDTQLEDITGLTLKITSYGKIIFSENINISEDTSLDNNIDISQDSIYINSNALPNFNKPATLQLYGLTFTDPRILKDGVVCPASICTEVNYSGGTLEFTVTGFTNYSAEETPTAPTPGPTGRASEGGTGLAGKRLIQKRFDVDTDMIRLQLKRGESLKRTMKVENTGEAPLTVTLSIERLGSFIFTPEKSFRLNPEEVKDVSLEFVSNAQPDVYTGRVVLASEGIQKFIPIILEVESEKVLYDVTLDIPAKYTKLTTEREIPLMVTIFNIAGPKTAEVEVEYLIITGINGDAEILASEKETVKINQQASFTKVIKLPRVMPFGEHLAVVKVRYGDSVGTTSRVFELVEKPEELSLAQKILTKNFVIIGIMIVLILSFAVFSSSYINHKKLKNIEKSQVKRLTHLYEKYTRTRHAEEKKEKALRLLEKEQALLDDAFKQNYISKEAHQKGKQRIDDLRKKIK